MRRRVRKYLGATREKGSCLKETQGETQSSRRNMEAEMGERLRATKLNLEAGTKSLV